MNMRFRLAFLALLLLWIPAATKAQISAAEASERALKRSQLTLPGSKPFHLIANLTEKDSPDSDYQAKVEMFWVSPEKWRRIITSETFSQVRVVNGQSVFEQNTGDYFPVWINNMLTSIFDPLPILDAIRKADKKIGMDLPPGIKLAETCADFPSRLDRWMICFQSDGLFSSIFTKGYAAEFRNYSKFGDKRVARLIEDDPEPGTHLQTRITTLEELNNPDEEMFEVQKPTPASEQINRVRVGDDFIRKAALGDTEIEWPSVGEGLLTGGCAVYVSADRTGQIRETWPGGCDNAALETPLRQAMLKWKLKPAISNGNPVQVESLMGFTFHTRLDSAKSLPTLTNEQVRALAKQIVEPKFPPDSGKPGTEFVVNISVDETGKLTGAGPASGMSNSVFFAIYAALQKWEFQPYMIDGKPQYFHAAVAFRLN
jgi:hypothetical protein